MSNLKNKALNKTADFIGETTLGKIVFYGALLTAPFTGGAVIGNALTVDYNDIGSEQSYLDTQDYLQQIKDIRAEYSNIYLLEEAIPNQQGVDAVLAMKEKQTDLSKIADKNLENLEDAIFSDPDLVEKDFAKIIKSYNRNLPVSKAPEMSYVALDECRVSNPENVKECMVDELSKADNIVQSLAFFCLIYYSALLAKGINNDSNSTSMPKKTASYLRKKADFQKNKY